MKYLNLGNAVIPQPDDSQPIISNQEEDQNKIYCSICESKNCIHDNREIKIKDLIEHAYGSGYYAEHKIQHSEKSAFELYWEKIKDLIEKEFPSESNQDKDKKFNMKCAICENKTELICRDCEEPVCKGCMMEFIEKTSFDYMICRTCREEDQDNMDTKKEYLVLNPLLLRALHNNLTDDEVDRIITALFKDEEQNNLDEREYLAQINKLSTESLKGMCMDLNDNELKNPYYNALYPADKACERFEDNKYFQHGSEVLMPEYSTLKSKDSNVVNTDVHPSESPVEVSRLVQYFNSHVSFEYEIKEFKCGYAVILVAHEDRYRVMDHLKNGDFDYCHMHDTTDCEKTFLYVKDYDKPRKDSNV